MQWQLLALVVMAATAVSAAPVETTAALSLERRSNFRFIKDWADDTDEEMDFTGDPFSGIPSTETKTLTQDVEEVSASVPTEKANDFRDEDAIKKTKLLDDNKEDQKDNDNLFTEPTGDSHDQDNDQSTEPLSDVATLADPDASAAKKKKKKKSKKKKAHPQLAFPDTPVESQDDAAFDLAIIAESPEKLVNHDAKFNRDTDTLLYHNYLAALAKFYKQPRVTEQSFRKTLDQELSALTTVERQLIHLQTPLSEIIQELYVVDQAFGEYAELLKTHVKRHLNRKRFHRVLVTDHDKELTAKQLNDILDEFKCDIKFILIAKTVAARSVEIAYLCHILSVANAYTKEFLQTSVPASDRQPNDDIIQNLRKWGREVESFSLGSYRNIKWINGVTFWDKLLKGKPF